MATKLHFLRLVTHFVNHICLLVINKTFQSGVLKYHSVWKVTFPYKYQPLLCNLYVFPTVFTTYFHQGARISQVKLGSEVCNRKVIILLRVEIWELLADMVTYCIPRIWSRPEE